MRKQWTLVAAVALGMSGCVDPTQPTPQDRQGLTQGYSAFSAKQYGPAEAAATSYIQKYPEGANVDEAYYLRGIARAGHDLNVPAASDLRMAIQKTKRADLKSKAYRTLGDMAFEGQRWNEARTYYQQAAAGAGSVDAMVGYRMGECYQAEGRWAEARPYFERVVSAPGEVATAAIVERARARAAATAFNLQFGAYRDVASAQKGAATVKASGIHAVVITEMRAGTPMYFVRAGVFRTLADAETARTSALRAYPGAIVVP